jgi:predicted GNAT family N-acyltransferase
MDYLVRFASTPEDRDAAFVLRRAVFEEEQNIPRPLDRDAHDSNADHVVAFDAEGRCVGTGRIVRLDTRTAQVGRQATAPAFRGKGVGAAVLADLERMARLRGVRELVVHAQLPAEPFYARRGFAREGEVFQDQGVPHVLMRKRLAAE